MPHKSRLVPCSFLAVLLILALACSGLAGGKDEAAAASTAAAAEDAGTSPAVTKGKETQSGSGGGGETPAAPTAKPGAGDGKAYLGDFQEADGYFFAALEIADPAEPALFYEEQEGMRLIAVRFLIGNQTGEQLYFSISDVAVKDSGDDVWESEFAAILNEIPSVLLDRGERVQGWLGFVIPEDREAVSLEYLYDYLGGKSVSLPLAEPPAGRAPVRADTARAPGPGSPLGQAMEGENLSLKAIRIEDPAEPAFPDFFDPPQGTHLISVEIEFGNNGEEAWLFAAYDINLVDSNGFLYAVDFFNGAELIESGEVEPGGSVRGWVSFVIPDGAKLESIKYYSIWMNEPLWAGLGE
jgi:hypothetical protein